MPSDATLMICGRLSNRTRPIAVLRLMTLLDGTAVTTLAHTAGHGVFVMYSSPFLDFTLACFCFDTDIFALYSQGHMSGVRDKLCRCSTDTRPAMCHVIHARLSTQRPLYPSTPPTPPHTTTYSRIDQGNEAALLEYESPAIRTTCLRTREKSVFLLFARYGRKLPSYDLAAFSPFRKIADLTSIGR